MTNVDDVLIKPKVVTNADLEDFLAGPSCQLGSDAISDFRNATLHKNKITARMRRAAYAARSEYLPEDCTKLQGITHYVGIFARIRATFLAWHFDRVAAAGNNLFTLRPSPEIETSEEHKSAAVEKVMQDVMSIPFPTPEAAASYARNQIGSLKLSIRNELFRNAEKAAAAMKVRMLDKMAEGGFSEAYFEWWLDYSLYPLAVMSFPNIKIEKKIARWNKGKPVYDYVVVMGFHRVSPFNFYWSEDSTTVNNGRFVIEHARLPYEELYKLKDKAAGIVKVNIDYLLNDGFPRPHLTTWLNTIFATDEKELFEPTSTYNGTIAGTFDCLKQHKKLTGAMLKKYGITEIYSPEREEIKDTETYETQIWVIDNRVVYIAPNIDPASERPYFVSSFMPEPGLLCGQGMYDMIADEERACCYAARSMLRQAEYSSWVAEINSARFGEGATPKTLMPMTVYKTEMDSLTGGQSAINIHQLPGGANMAPLIALVDKFDMAAQKKLGIFDMMSGATSDISSGLRTDRGFATVQSNGNKLINFREELTDKFVFNRLFQCLWRYLMAYDPDESIKFDADVEMRGLTSVSTEEALRQNAIQVLQYITPVLSMQAQMGKDFGVTDIMMRDVVFKAMGQLGADTSKMRDPDAEQEAMNLINAGSDSAPIQPVQGMSARSNVPLLPDQASQLPAG